MKSLTHTLTRKCVTCKETKPLDQYYRSGKQTRRRECIKCILERGKRDRWRQRVEGKYWYQEATGNKLALPYSFEVRFGSRWIKYRRSYLLALRLLEALLQHNNNRKALRILRYHRSRLPKTLPYVIAFEGDEWPIASRAINLCKEHTKDKEVRRHLTNLYIKFWKAKAEAKHDYFDD